MRQNLRVAIVHDFMVGGGAERVVEQLLAMYPDAPLYTSCISEQWREKLRDRDVRVGVLNAAFFHKTRKFIPLFRRWWFESLDLTDFDLVISSSSAEAKAVKKLKKGAVHVSYCHSPTHYYWVRYDEYIKNPGFGLFDPVARLGLKLLVGPMKKWDYEVAQRPDLMIANSTCTQERIKKYYHRDSIVVHPPVDIDRFLLNEGERTGFVVAGRQTPYKRIDLAVEACTQAELPLKVIGRGPDHDKLVKLAGPTIEFLTSVSDADMSRHFGAAKAFIFPNEDDFGIVPVEAMATGTPVVAYKKGGALDYVRDGETGMFFEEQNAESLAQTLKRSEQNEFDARLIRHAAEDFSPQVFRQKMTDVINRTLGGTTTAQDFDGRTE